MYHFGGHQWKSKLIFKEFVLRIEYLIHKSINHIWFSGIGFYAYGCPWDKIEMLTLFNIIDQFYTFFSIIFSPSNYEKVIRRFNKIQDFSFDDDDIDDTLIFIRNHGHVCDMTKIFPNMLQLWRFCRCIPTPNYINVHGMYEVGYSWVLHNNIIKYDILNNSDLKFENEINLISLMSCQNDISFWNLSLERLGVKYTYELVNFFDEVEILNSIIHGYLKILMQQDNINFKCINPLSLVPQDHYKRYLALLFTLNINNADIFGESDSSDSDSSDSSDSY